MTDAEKRTLDGRKSNLVMQAAAALAADDFDRLAEIEKSLALLDKLTARVETTPANPEMEK